MLFVPTLLSSWLTETLCFSILLEHQKAPHFIEDVLREEYIQRPGVVGDDPLVQSQYGLVPGLEPANLWCGLVMIFNSIIILKSIVKNIIITITYIAIITMTTL